jgi:hypothetical protein
MIFSVRPGARNVVLVDASRLEEAHIMISGCEAFSKEDTDFLLITS